MERQRSFSFKPTRFLVFFFTISSSLLLLSYFSIWVFKSAPSVPREIPLQFSTPSFNLGLKPLNVQILTGFTGNSNVIEVKNSILIDTLLRKYDNSSGNPLVSDSERVQRKGNESEVYRKGNQIEFENVILTSIKNRKPTNSSGETGVSGSERIQRKGNESEVYRKGTESEFQKGILTSITKKKPTNSSGEIKFSGIERIEGKKGRECDISSGRWVFDESYPLYTNRSCPFIDEGFNCESNGRLDRDYMKWRWKPHDCNIPRFNAVKMLELIRGKRLVFVGDSMNRNQWESMLCLLRGAISDPKRVYETHGRRITKEKGNYSFKFVDYKCTVEFYVTHFLVHESKARVGQRRVPTLRIDTVDKRSSRWKGADILVFNTAHWWSHYKTRAGINYYQEGTQVHPRLDVSVAFKRALMTWASWVDKHVTPGKTQVFFRSSAPSHFRGGQWNSGGHCKEATQPLDGTTATSYPERNKIIEEVLKQMKTPVTLLNITSLSEYRIDGHPSIYGRKTGKSYPSRIQDCSHWCLPGVPDTWNELLYFSLQTKQKSTFKE